MIWTLSSIEVWHLLTEPRGWSGKRCARWVGDQVADPVLARWSCGRFSLVSGAPRQGCGGVRSKPSHLRTNAITA